MKATSNGVSLNSSEGERKNINSELWHACAGPLVSLPPVGSLVVYFPQGHSEQVAASMQKQTDFIPSYPNLPSKLICMLHNVTLHADLETDEVYAQMTLQPVNKYEKEAIFASDLGLKQSRQPAEFFCKTLTASDTSTHGGFSVPRRAAEKIFPPLDFNLQPPAQELTAKDLHDTSWTFRHIYRGQPKRHLLTTGWSVFVSTKRLFAGDSVLFIRDEKSQLLLGIRRASRQQPALSSSVISSDSMHIGILAAAAHAAANSSPFTIFYNPRASPSEFVVPLAKYNKAMYTQVSLGMRFRMMFETEECGVRRYMGTITGISDLDAVRWKGSQWRNLQVGWDESTAGERPSRVSIWEIEPVVTPFYICPPPFFRPKFPRQPGMPDDDSEIDNAFKRAMPWLGDEFGMKEPPSSIFPGLSLFQWMNMQQSNNHFSAGQAGFLPSMVSPNNLPNNLTAEDSAKLLSFQSPGLAGSNIQFNKPNTLNQFSQLAQQSNAWGSQQQLQQLLQGSVQNPQLPHQPQQLPTQQQPKWQQRQLPVQQLSQQQPQQLAGMQQQPPVQQQHQPQFQQANVQPHQLAANLSNSMTSIAAPASHLSNQAAVQTKVSYSQPQIQQQQMLPSNIQPTQNAPVTRNSSLLQDMQLQQNGLTNQSPLQTLQQNGAQKPQHQLQVPQLSQQGLSQQRMQLLQKLQQQQQQMLSPSNPLIQTQLLQTQQNQQSQQGPVSQSQQIEASNSYSSSMLMQPPPIPITQTNKPFGPVRAHSGITDVDAPSCSTSPSTNNCQVSSSNFLNRSSNGPTVLVSEPVVGPVTNMIHELHGKNDSGVKQELAALKGSEQMKYKGMVMDQLEASSSGTSYCLDAGTTPQSLAIPALLENDVQSTPRNNMSYAANIDGLTSDPLLSRGYDSQKDLQNLLSNYGGAPRDIETELSTADISSQSFGVPNITFKSGCSNDVAINDAAVLGGGLWANQAQRMRTYTKVQKRGSVGRSIDVTRYRGYDDLRHDLARMFGIEGQLEDPQTSDWKLVYVDHENDILLVGDDPWEEFVNCVRGIKILSSAEVQQMSLAGDLASVPVPNQACSGTDSGAWRHYDDNSAASFNR